MQQFKNFYNDFNGCKRIANIPVALRGRSPEGVPDCGQEQRRPRVRSTDQALGRRACPLGTKGQRPAGTTTGLLGSLAGRGRKGSRLIPLSQPIPEARPQPEIAAWSAETALRT